MDLRLERSGVDVVGLKSLSINSLIIWLYLYARVVTILPDG